MSAESENTLQIARRFDAVPEHLFDAWLDAETARKWMFTSPEREENHTEIDARVGGRWTIIDRRAGTDYKALGEYFENARPSRLVFSFGMPQFPAEFCRVVVDIAPEGSGCMLNLAQENLPRQFHGDTEKGRNQMFDALDALLERPAI